MLTDFIDTVKDIMFPSLCFACTHKTRYSVLCHNCSSKITLLRPPLCRYCSRPLNLTQPIICKECSKKIFPFDRLISIAAYKEPLIGLIHLFKYKNYDFIGEYLASIMVSHCLKTGFNPCNYSFITQVPMHKHKLKQRGYNQSHLLAKSLSKHFKIQHHDDIIGALINKPSQTKLSPDKRKSNVSEVFTSVKDLRRKNILLVDDIYTTGATIHSCCKVMRECGAERITVLTLAKTLSS